MISIFLHGRWVQVSVNKDYNFKYGTGHTDLLQEKSPCRSAMFNVIRM